MLLHYYPINNEITENYNDILSRYTLRDVSFSEGILKFDDIIHELLLQQLKDYVEKDVAISTCYYMALEEQKADFDVLCFHAEHAIVKQSSFWEHLFQILNTYLELHMVPAKRLINQKEEKWKVTNILNIKKLKWKSYKFNPILEQQIKPQPSFLSRINIIQKTKKIFINDIHLRPLVNMSNQQHWSMLRNLRNDIIHYKFLRQRGFVNLVEEDATGILFSPQDKTVDHATISSLLSRCLADIYTAIELSTEFIRKDLVPRRKDSTQTEFFMIKVLCKNEEEKPYLIPKIFLDIDNNLGDNPYRGIFCPGCFSDDLVITEEDHLVSEKTYNQAVGYYIGEKVQSYMEKKTKELEDKA